MPSGLINDRYQLGERLGRGGMGEVYRAIDLRLEREVAVKFLDVAMVESATSRERFTREGRAAGRLSHANIVAVYDTGEWPDQASSLMIPYIVMELVNGQTLRDVLHRNGRFEPAEALTIVERVLSALDYSHARGIIHRDIKPANIMVTDFGEIKVMDFGIARLEAADSLTRTASMIGSPQYLSPEQARGEKADQRSDVYGTGCLLYELLTGQT
ncbi:MAG: protein kinase, partial [Propionibacteriaceae bacterium]|nr:protein kinase [Propionibacteriaceae bacterium]